MLTQAGHEVWIGDAAKIRASEVRQQKHDRRDAQLLLRLLVEGRFPRLWTPSSSQRDLRQLLLHRHKLVRLRAQVKNELQHLAMNQGLQKKRRLWSEAGQRRLQELPLRPWAGRRREDLLGLLATLDQQIEPLDQAVEQAAARDAHARLLLTQPGVGPVTALAFVLTLGDVSRFPRGKQVASYLGLIPREYSSGGRQRLGSISKQGNRLMRQWLVEAAQSAVRYDPQFRSEYLHRCHQKPRGVAKVAAARKLAIRLYWMLRTRTPYPQIVRTESSPWVPLVVRQPTDRPKD
jgi:transposase